MILDGGRSSRIGPSPTNARISPGPAKKISAGLPSCEAHRVQGVDLRILAQAIDRARIDRQGPARADHEVGVVPQGGVGKDVEKGAHDQRVLNTRPEANPLEYHAVVFQGVPHEREVFAGIDVAGAGVTGLDDVRGDDVELSIGQRQEVPPVVDAHGDVGLLSKS